MLELLYCVLVAIRSISLMTDLVLDSGQSRQLCLTLEPLARERAEECQLFLTIFRSLC